MTEQPIAIQAQGLGKMYRIGGQKQAKYNIRELLTQLSLEPFRRLNALRQGIAPTHSDKMFWALKDINFTIYKGESVGIIGVNGSGKSTLLKIISHIVEPTEGSVRTVGRIASLLEVGAGFHPELTGRENVYLNGTILGMSRHEIDEKFEDIVEFSEIREFIDTPIKRYSSGMRSRLGFAIAIHTSPDILILDEVLAVGDAGFREKCMREIEKIKLTGTTVLIVSHAMSHLTRLATRSIWLKQGQIYQMGEAHDLAKIYQDEIVGSRKATDDE